MEYTRLGTSGLKISRIVLGCMSFGAPGTGRDWTLDQVGAEPVYPAVNDEVDQAYRSKYGRYAQSVIDAITGPEARSAALRLVPRRAGS
jgi:hypothetical protein